MALKNITFYTDENNLEDIVKFIENKGNRGKKGYSLYSSVFRIEYVEDLNTFFDKKYWIRISSKHDPDINSVERLLDRLKLVLLQSTLGKTYLFLETITYTANPGGLKRTIDFIESRLNLERQTKKQIFFLENASEYKTHILQPHEILNREYIITLRSKNWPKYENFNFLREIIKEYL